VPPSSPGALLIEHALADGADRTTIAILRIAVLDLRNEEEFRRAEDREELTVARDQWASARTPAYTIAAGRMRTPEVA
jgi:hypothetical protein